MAFDDSVQNNTVPAPVAPPAGLAAMAQPGANVAPAQPTPTAPAVSAPVSPATDVTSQLAPFEAQRNAHLQNAADLNQPAAPAKPVPHARLLAMVTGLADGLSAFGTSLATHGKEGGAQEVEQLQGEEQQQKINAQNAALAQKNAAVQQQVMAANIAQMQMQNVMLMHTIPNDITKSDLEVKGAAQTQAITGADFQASHGGMKPEEFSAALSGTEPASGTAGSFFTTNAQQQLGAATKILGADDPYVQKLQTILSDPKATPKDLWTATNQVQSQLGLQEKATTALTAKEAAETNAPFGPKADALNAAMLQRYQVLNPNAKSLPSGLLMSPDSTPKDFDRADKILQQTENAQSTQASRALSDQIRQQTLSLIKGPEGIDPKATGQDYLTALKIADPAQYAELTGYASGRLELSPQVARTAQGQGLLKQILRAYPDYDPSKAPAYAAIRKDFTSGKTSTGINSYNTAIAHLGTMFDHVANASTLELNNPASDVRRQLDSDVNFVSSELAKAVANGQMTEGEKDQAEAAINGKTFGIATADKYKTQIKEVVKLLDGKLGSYQNQWDNGMVKGVDEPVILSDASKAALAHIAGTGAAPTVVAVITDKATGKVTGHRMSDGSIRR